MALRLYPSSGVAVCGLSHGRWGLAWAMMHQTSMPTPVSPAQGAAQLDADLAAMAAVFGEYTSRPAAHLKESKEACRLLTMPHDAAVELLAALGAQPAAAKQLLAPHGVKALNAEQAAVVLMQRLDVLTIKSRGHAAVAAPAARGAVRASASVV
jgi:hypothetical protein